MNGGGLFDKDGPRWFNIPAHRPFLADLARGLIDCLSAEDLAQAVILTPNQRSARALAAAFADAAPQGLLLPQLRPIGDLEEGEAPFEPGDLSLDLPAAITPWKRRFELAAMVAKRQEGLTAGQALEMADALGGLIDSLQIEEIDPAGRIEALVEGELAQHWHRSAALLTGVLAEWPRRLRELGLMDVNERRVRLLRALRDRWAATPPLHALIAAGSTGTAPPAADLLAVVAAAPRGLVVLPGLDEALAAEAWTEVEGDEQHPQGSLARLLKRSRIARSDVALWPASRGGSARWRRLLINDALRPADATSGWLDRIKQMKAEGETAGIDAFSAGLEGLSIATARDDDEAALACALLLRETLETSDKTVALITPDAALARRVAVRLGRFGIEAQSSSGRPLAQFPVAVLAALAAQLTIDPEDPVALLAVLKHPLTRLGLEADECAAMALQLEVPVLRGPRRSRADTLTMAEAKDRPVALAQTLFNALDIAAAPFAAGKARPADAARALVEALQAIGGQDLWSGPDGEAAATLFSALIHEGEGMPPASAIGFFDLLQRLLTGETVRTVSPGHPRVQILGALEARLVRADRLVLAGLEEGVWPRIPPADPFLSRPMRKTLGLPSPERRVGLSAHDFAQAACAAEVVLVHAERRDGAPAVPSRWVWRLRTLVAGAGAVLPNRDDILALARALDAPDKSDTIERPRPRPPVEDRPKLLYVTRIEALTRDPYAVWARDILKLKALDRPDAPVDARVRGTAIHKAFEILTEQFPGALPDDAADRFEGFYLSALAEKGMSAPDLTRERALAREAAAWVVTYERNRRADGRRIVVEAEGKLTIKTAGGPFELRAKADRIEVGRDGQLHVVDYKTGSVPSIKAVKSGFSPQLTLTAAIASAGGYADIPPGGAGELIYLKITGRRPAGKAELRGNAEGTVGNLPPSPEMAALALNGLRALIELYQDPDRPYLSRVAPQFLHDYAGDYGHLARVFEWSTAGGEDEE